MKALEIKNELLLLLSKTDDEATLKAVCDYFAAAIYETKLIKIGMEQIEKGQVISHKEARKKIDQLLQKKSKK